MLLEQKNLNLPIRLRRNRQSEAIRRMVRETELNAADLVVPLFLIDGENRSVAIESMPKIERFSIDLAVKKAKELEEKIIAQQTTQGNSDQ